jgi:hypothetical protein
MHTRSILAIARKDALDLVLNKSTLVLLMTPFFLALLFLVINLLLSSHTTNVLVYNPGKSGIEQIIDHESVNIKVTYANSPDQVTAAFGPSGRYNRGLRRSDTTTDGLYPARFSFQHRSGIADRQHCQYNQRGRGIWWIDVLPLCLALILRRPIHATAG